jgi:hypothetical protein
MDRRRIFQLTGDLRAKGMDVWCLEQHEQKTWWRGTRRWGRLVHAPCAVAVTAKSLLVCAFADPVHPYDLQRVFGTSTVPGLMQQLRRRAGWAAFAVRRVAARMRAIASR